MRPASATMTLAMLAASAAVPCGAWAQAVPKPAAKAPAKAAKDAPLPAGASASITTTLPTTGENIAQLAFDGDPKTAFRSHRAPAGDDTFTLSFDGPVKLGGVSVVTGKPEGGETLLAGVLEASRDGTAYEPVATFAAGTAKADLKNAEFRAVRIRATKEGHEALTIREIVLDGRPVPVFKYPVEFTLDVTDAPEMKEWGEKVVRLCTKWYPLIAEELRSERFSPPRKVSITLKNDYKGVAYASGDRIVGSVKYFKDRPEDVGAMIHETAHVVQQYRGGNPPGWLVEGIADYIRYHKYEPKPRRLNADRVKYSDSYGTSAAFLAWVADKHDKDIVRKLNEACRQRTYRPDLWKDLTGKTIEQLGDEWKASLKAGTPA